MLANALIIFILQASPATTAVTTDFYNDDFIADVQSIKNENPALTDRVAVSWKQAKSHCSKIYSDLVAQRADTNLWTLGAVGFGVLVPAASAYSCLKSPMESCNRNMAVGIAFSSGVATALGGILSSKTSQNARLEEKRQLIRLAELNLEKELSKIRNIEPGSDTEMAALGAVQTYKSFCIANDISN